MKGKEERKRREERARGTQEPCGWRNAKYDMCEGNLP